MDSENHLFSKHFLTKVCGIIDSKGYEFELTLGDSEGQGSLVCCGPWHCKESDTAEQLSDYRNCFEIELVLEPRGISERAG